MPGCPRRGLLVGADGGVRRSATRPARWPPATRCLLAGPVPRAALPHGAYFGVASLVAAELAPPGREGRAVADGDARPVGRQRRSGSRPPPGSASTLGWRSAYWAGRRARRAHRRCWCSRSCRASRATAEATGRRELRRVPASRRCWLTLLAGAIGFGGMFAVYSYIAPTVTRSAACAEGPVPVFLLAFGLGMVVGTWLGGRLADWSVFRSLLGLVGRRWSRSWSRSPGRLRHGWLGLIPSSC